MTTYRFSGFIDNGERKNSFTREIEAESMKHAESLLYAMLGSEHSANRSKITVEDSEEV